MFFPNPKFFFPVARFCFRVSRFRPAYRFPNTTVYHALPPAIRQTLLLHRGPFPADLICHLIPVAFFLFVCLILFYLELSNYLVFVHNYLSSSMSLSLHTLLQFT